MTYQLEDNEDEVYRLRFSVSLHYWNVLKQIPPLDLIGWDKERCEKFLEEIEDE